MRRLGGFRIDRIGFARSIAGFTGPRGWISSDATWLNWDVDRSRSGRTSDLTRRTGNFRNDGRFYGQPFGFFLYISRYSAHRFGNTLYVRRSTPGECCNVAGVSAGKPGRFGMSLYVARSRLAGRVVSPGKNCHEPRRFGIVLYERAECPAHRAARSVRRTERADHFGVFRSLRALPSTRSLAMILMHGLKALAHLTRLHVLELLKTPAACRDRTASRTARRYAEARTRVVGAPQCHGYK